MIVDASADLADALRNLLAMFDDKEHGLKSLTGSRWNACGCTCCDDDDDISDEINEILDSEAAINARRLLARVEWS